MAKQIFINLPVSNLGQATEFYEKLGFKKNPMFSDQNASSLIWTEQIVVMLLKTDFYQRFVPHKKIIDAKSTSGVLLCLSMNTREGVDNFVEIAKANGGKILKNEVNGQDNEAMYGKSIEDLDGHVWEIVYMDMSKYKKQ